MTQGFTTNSISQTPYNTNVVINGALSLWQRGVTFASTANATRVADRFKWAQAGTMVVTVSQSTDVPTAAQCGILAPSSLLTTVNTAEASLGANDYAAMVYVIEGFDWAKLAQNTFTISFWFKANVTGTYALALTNNDTSWSYVNEIVVSNTGWNKFSFTIPASPASGGWQYTTGAGLYMYFTYAAGTAYQTPANTWFAGNKITTANCTNGMATIGNTFQFTMLQVERGNVASPFYLRSFGEELALAQRYYQLSYPLGTYAGALTSSGVRNYIAVTAFGGGTNLTNDIFPVSMRATPTVTIYSNNTGASGKFYNANAGTDAPCTVAAPSTTGYVINTTNAIPSTNQVIQWQWSADAEL